MLFSGVWTSVFTSTVNNSIHSVHWTDWHNISENKHGDQPCFIGTEDLKYVEAFGNKDSDYTEVNEITMKKRRITKDARMHPLRNKVLPIIHKNNLR